MQFRLFSYAIAILCFTVVNANATVITTYSDRAAFDAMVGVTTLEDFGTTYYTPPGYILDSTINSDLQAGVQFSTTPYDHESLTGTTGWGLDVTIAGTSPYEGAFLDALGSSRNLTMVFDPLVSAFGFDTSNSSMEQFDVFIYFESGGFYKNTFKSPTLELSFFGFQSDLIDINKVEIISNDDMFGFMLDNLAFGTTDTGSNLDTGTNPGSSSIPLPNSFMLFAVGMVGFLFSKRRDKII